MKGRISVKTKIIDAMTSLVVSQSGMVTKVNKTMVNWKRWLLME